LLVGLLPSEIQRSLVVEASCGALKLTVYFPSFDGNIGEKEETS
jgi:hypothetical protein